MTKRIVALLIFPLTVTGLMTGCQNGMSRLTGRAQKPPHLSAYGARFSGAARSSSHKDPFLHAGRGHAPQNAPSGQASVHIPSAGHAARSTHGAQSTHATRSTATSNDSQTVVHAGYQQPAHPASQSSGQQPMPTQSGQHQWQPRTSSGMSGQPEPFAAPH